MVVGWQLNAAATSRIVFPIYRVPQLLVSAREIGVSEPVGPPISSDAHGLNRAVVKIVRRIRGQWMKETNRSGMLKQKPSNSIREEVET